MNHFYSLGHKWWKRSGWRNFWHWVQKWWNGKVVGEWSMYERLPDIKMVFENTVSIINCIWGRDAAKLAAEVEYCIESKGTASCSREKGNISQGRTLWPTSGNCSRSCHCKTRYVSCSSFGCDKGNISSSQMNNYNLRVYRKGQEWQYHAEIPLTLVHGTLLCTPICAVCRSDDLIWR